MPNHVLIISAMPNNNLLKLKLPVFPTVFCRNTWTITWIKLQTGRSTLYTYTFRHSKQANNFIPKQTLELNLEPVVRKEKYR